MEQRAEQLNQQQEHLSGYQLTTLILRNGKRLKLKPAEVLVFSALATYWNGKPVYPRIKTLADDTAQSEKTVRTALNGLLAKGYLIKSKCGKNANVYNLNVNAVKSAIESGKNDLTSTVNFTAPYNKKSYHDNSDQQQRDSTAQQTKKNDVVVSISNKKKSEPVSLNDIPDIIKSNPKIKNPIGYWVSLSAEVKAETIRKDKAEKDKAERLAELREQKRIEKLKAEQERQEREKELSKPLSEQWTKQQAIKFVYSLRNFPRLPKNGLATDLINLYELDTKQIFQMIPEQIEKL